MIERDLDALMRRTRLRPLPDQRLQPLEGLLFGSAITLAGLLMIVAVGEPARSARVALATLAHLRRRLHAAQAAVVVRHGDRRDPRRAAADHRLGGGARRAAAKAWVLFGIMFLWQLPHFLAIAWMYREDYARAGFPMLPVIEPDGRSTGRQAVVYAAALLPLSLAPTLMRHGRRRSISPARWCSGWRSCG